MKTVRSKWQIIESELTSMIVYAIKESKSYPKKQWLPVREFDIDILEI